MGLTAAARGAGLAATALGIAALTGCGSTATVVPAALPDRPLKAAAAASLALRGIALDSCSAWRLVSIESLRRNRAAADHYAALASQLAARYATVASRYETERKNLGPVQFLPPAEPLLAAELGTCWI